MVLATNADRVIDQVLENLDGLAQVVAIIIVAIKVILV